jgi:ABC-type glutathione transport system ATPase component
MNPLAKPMAENHIHWNEALVRRSERASLNGHRSVILWLTGLSGAGKSTLAHAIERRLYDLDCSDFVFDGDNVRHGLCADLGFSQPDREKISGAQGKWPDCLPRPVSLRSLPSYRLFAPIVNGYGLW